ncbi:MAG: hypothetical protein IT385_01275 [Deltaproteobacteria bacterium]|nr:hypothetical protein [Deltaproteobacteria bacterium]
MNHAQTSPAPAPPTPSQSGPAPAGGSPTQSLRGLPYDAQAAALAPSDEMFDPVKHMPAMGQDHTKARAGDNVMFDPAAHMAAMGQDHTKARAGDNVMFDPAAHMGAMLPSASARNVAQAKTATMPPPAEEAAPVGVGDPAKLDAVRLEVLGKDLRAELARSQQAATELRPRLDEIDQALGDATGDRRAELEAKRKEITAGLDAMDKKTVSAKKDLELLAKGPAVTPAQLNDMLARRQVTAAQQATGDRSQATTLDDKGLHKVTTVTWNKMNDDGASVSGEASQKASLAADLKSASHSDSKTVTEVKGAQTKVSNAATVSTFDFDKLGVSQSETKGELVDDGKSKVGQSATVSRSLGIGGASRTQSETATLGDEKRSDSKSVGVTRGDGKVGLTRSQTNSQEKGDGSGSSHGVTTDRGVIAGKDGVGVYTNREQSADRKLSNGMSVNGKVAAGGKCVYNIEPVPDTNPTLYQITGRITVDASLGAGGGADKESKSKQSKGSASVGGGASATVELRFSKRLDAEATKAWQAQVSQVGNGERELMILTTGLRQIGANVTNELKDGEAIGLSREVKGNLKGEASGKSGGGSLGGGLGFEKGQKFEGEVRRDGNATTTDLKVTDASASSGNLKGGFGLASMTLGGKKSESKGVGYKFKIPDSHPHAAKLRAEAETLRTSEEFARFAAAHPELIAAKTDIKGSGTDVTTGISIGPLGAQMTSGGSVNSEKTEEYDAQGKVVATNARHIGESHLGGKMNIGPISLGGSNAKEQIDASVRTTKDAAGKDVQVATADVSDARDESSVDVAGTLDGLGAAAKKPLGLLTGATPVVKEQQKQEVAGFFMDDGDFNMVMAKANNVKDWNKAFSRVANMEDWERCRQEIVAAGGDKEKVAKALAKYSGGGEHKRQRNLEELLGVHQGGGGDRYEFPDGLGDCKKDYLALVVNNPMGEVDALVQSNKLQDAAQKAQVLADRVGAMHNKVTSKRGEFKDANVFGEMITRIGKRQSELGLKALELTAKASGKEVTPEALDRAKAVQEFNRLLEACKEFKAQEARLFGLIQKNHEGLMGNHNEPENVKHVNQLRANVKIWQPQYQEMCDLAFQHGLSDASRNYKTFKPDAVRLQIAYKGNNPNSLEATNASLQAESSEKMAADQSRELGKRVGADLALTAGMTKTASGTYFRAYSADEKQAAEAKQLLEIKPRVDADVKSREAAMLAAKANAQGAMGKCNRLTSNGTWDAVSPAAKGPYNEGYRLFSSAQRSWQAALAASKATTFAGITKYFPSAQAAVSEYRDAADSFKKGDALQG